MPLTVDELIEKSKDQRKRERYEEALVSSLAAVDAEPDNADAWWQVALNRRAIGDTRNVVPALRKTVELAPHFATGWARLGSALMIIKEDGEAKKSFETALKCDSEELEALEALSEIYSRDEDGTQDEEELSILSRIEDQAGLSSLQLNRFGNLHYKKKHFYDAIKYWQRDVTFSKSAASLFNLGLAYNQPEVSQYADAVDIWRLTARRFPDYKRPIEELAKILPRLLKLTREVRLQNETLLPKDQWYSDYLNPFELLNPQDDLDLDDLDSKTLQKLKKSLLQEIDLEDGSVSWMPNATIDKSRAIGVCAELNDDRKRVFHWQVFQNKPLLDFLCKGSHEHFLVDEQDDKLDIIELLEDKKNGFQEWLSEPFTYQFDRVLSKAIDSRNLVVLECLLEGRRWVSPLHADRCFENTRRVVDHLLEPLRKANIGADDEKPAVLEIKEILGRGSLVGIINLLPTYFQDYQNEAVSQIRGISISCFNSHDDSDLSREVLQLTKMFRFKSAALNSQLDEDFEKIEELIREEGKQEIKLTSGADKWEINKKGVKLSDLFIDATEVSSLRWGILMTREQMRTVHDFLFVVCAEDGRQIKFSWSTSHEIEKSKKHFDNLIDAAFSYLCHLAAQSLRGPIRLRSRIWRWAVRGGCARCRAFPCADSPLRGPPRSAPQSRTPTISVGS
jgi:tetratricopeptide (TPR) repeat protein